MTAAVNYDPYDVDIDADPYPVFRRLSLFRWLASNTMWFDFHLMAGTVGPMFIILHSALRLDTWVSAAFWSMAIVVVSGFLGRYLYTQVPALSSGVELEELDHERAFQKARPRLTVPMAEIDREAVMVVLDELAGPRGPDDRDRAPSRRRAEGAAAAALVEESARSIHRDPHRIRRRSHLGLVVPCLVGFDA